MSGLVFRVSFLAAVIFLNVTFVVHVSFSAPAHAAEKTDKANAVDWSNRGLRSLEANAYTQAVSDFTEALNRLESSGLGDFRQAAKQAALVKGYLEIDRISDQAYTIALCYNGRGTAYGCMGKLKNAIDDFDKALKTYPEYGKALSNRGSAYMNTGHIEAALKDFDLATKVEPTLVEPFKNRAKIYRGMHRVQLAEEQSARARKMAVPPSDYDTGFRAFVSRLVREALIIAPNNAYLLNSRGACTTVLKDQRTAIKDFHRARAIDPKFAHPYQNEARSLFRLGDNEAAFKVMRQAAAALPKDATIQDWVAKEFLDHHKYKEALSYSDIAVRLDPRCPSALTNRGVAKFALHRPKQAIEDCDRAIAIDKNYANAWATKSAALLDFKAYKATVETATKAIALDSEDRNAYHNRGLAYMRLGMLDKADQDLERAIQLTPDDPYTRKFSSELAAHRGSMELMMADRAVGATSKDAAKVISKEALTKELSSYSSVIAVAPSQPAPYYDRALLAVAAGKLPDAAKDLRRFLDLTKWRGKTSGYAASLLVLVLREMKDMAEANKKLQEAKRLIDAKEQVPILKYLLKTMDEKTLWALPADPAEKTRNRLFCAIAVLQTGAKKKAHALFEGIKITGDPNIDESILLPTFLKKPGGG